MLGRDAANRNTEGTEVTKVTEDYNGNRRAFVRSLGGKDSADPLGSHPAASCSP